jgi:hypothetical protein
MSGTGEQGAYTTRLRRGADIIAAFFIADVVLLGYILSGYLFASHIRIPEQRIVASGRSYGLSAKPSPVVLWRPPSRPAKAAVEVIDLSAARTSENATPAYRPVSRSGGAAGVKAQGWRAAPTGLSASTTAERNDAT